MHNMLHVDNCCTGLAEVLCLHTSAPKLNYFLPLLTSTEHMQAHGLQNGVYHDCVHISIIQVSRLNR